MTLLCDREIRDLCAASWPLTYACPTAGKRSESVTNERPMIDPFVQDLVEEGIVSYGLTSCGYDFRAGNTWYVFTACTESWKEFWGQTHSYLLRNSVPADLQKVLVIDPKKPLPAEAYEEIKVPDHDSIIIPPRGYALTHSKEYVRMPRDVAGVCLGKSTYARVGVHLNCTPLEPGWEGQVTIELANSTEHAVKVYAGEGIMQVQFEKIAAPDKSYADRKGKYQGQVGVTPHRVRGT